MVVLQLGTIMIHLIRHNISLGACLFAALAGLGIIVAGLFQAVGVVSMFGMLSKADQAGQGINWLFVWGLVSQHAIMVLLGAVLLYFSARGFVRRWKAGPPSEEEGVGKSATAKVFGLLLYGAGALYGAYGLIVGMEPLIGDVQLATGGDTVAARVIGIEPAPEIHWDLYRVKYQFRTKDGQAVQGVSNQFSYRASKMLEEGDVDVTYLVADPSVSKANFVFSIFDVFKFYGGQFVILLIGIWGFAKNLQGLTPSPGRRVAADEPELPRIASPPASSNGKRVFGRRGVAR
jgi:hypothetical protein